MGEVESMKVLVLGSTGMLGTAIINELSKFNELEVFGTFNEETEVIANSEIRYLACNVTLPNNLERVFIETTPNVVINCISPRKTEILKGNVLNIVPLCTLLPHRLEFLCAEINSRLIHISTDGVFSGKRGCYVETDIPDPVDIYGHSKLLGEVFGLNSVSIRTSIFGHEKMTGVGLLNWLLSQDGGSCRGYPKAIFSGMPVTTLAKIIKSHFLDKNDLHGIYHIGASPISKYDLLKIISDVYSLNITIIPDYTVKIDRSLSSEKFFRATGFVVPQCQEMIETMHANYLGKKI